MKVIFKGEENVRPWWVGREAECPQCNARVLLERGDDQLAIWVQYDEKRAILYCANCGGNLVANR